MKTDQIIEIADLGVASEETRGALPGSNESIGRQKSVGISDDD